MSDKPEIRYLGDLQRLDLKSGDVLVLSVPRSLSEEALRHFKEKMSAKFGYKHEVIILTGGMTLSVASPASEAA